MLTTTQLRNAWGPPCAAASTRVTIDLHGAGRITVDRRTEAAFRALNACLKAHGYPTRRADTGAYNCRRITGGTGYSLHAYGIAADLNWQTNPYGRSLKTDMPPAMRAAIKAIRTRNGRQVFGWGGDYRTNKDAMHFEVVCTPGDLATGIDPATVPGHRQPAPAADPNAGRHYRTFVAGTDDHLIYKLGGRNDQVAELQLLFGLPVDGIYGPNTVRAVVHLKGAAKWADASGAQDRSSRVDERFAKAVRALVAGR